jgi:hypothetical protein
VTKWRFVGYRPDKGRDGWCCYPALLVNSEGEKVYTRCRSTRRSKCEHCSTIHRGDVAAVGRSGAVVDNPSDRVYLLTLTGPGVDVLPWDTSKCSHGPAVECSGKLGCVVDEHAAAMWHNNVAQRWSWFVTEVRRRLGDGAGVQFLKTWELQDRGVLHVHALFRVTGVVRDRRVRAAVRLARSRWGFGDRYKLDAINLADPAGAARAAGYVAKYVSKSCDALPAVRRLNYATGELRVGGIRPWSASRSWGITMKQIRESRVAWASSVGASAGGAAATPPGDAAGVALDLNKDRYAGDPHALVDQWVDRLL